MRVHTTGRGLIAATCVMVLGLCLVAGCPQQTATQATFTAGTGASDIGTADDGKGTTFEITEQGDGFSVTSNGTQGTATFDVDGEGRITHLETSLMNIDYVYNADGTVTVSGTVTVGNEQIAVNEVATSDEIPTAKPRLRSARGSICGAVDFFCENLDAILLYLEAALQHEAGWQENPDSDPGIALSNIAIEVAVSATMAKITGPLQEFCEIWPEIRPELSDICS